MSRHHASTAHEVTHLINEVQHMPASEVNNLYGIELKEDGKVFDPTYNMTFDGVGEWANFTVEQEYGDLYDDKYDHYDDEH